MYSRKPVKKLNKVFRGNKYIKKSTTKVPNTKMDIKSGKKNIKRKY